MDDFFYFGIVFPAIAGALWGLLTYDKNKVRGTKARRRGGLRWMGNRKRAAREREKPYGLPWMGGTMHPKKKDYFED